MQLLSNEKKKYEVSYRLGNETKRKEFTSKDKALEYANSFSVSKLSKWVVLTTMERLK